MKQLKLNRERATIFAQELTTLFRENDMDDALNVLMGFTAALVDVASAVKKNTTSNGNDGTERLVLTWMKNMDKVSDLNFRKYIDVKK